MKRVFAALLGLAFVSLLIAGIGSARAQGPAPAPAPGPQSLPDGGTAGESAYGCVESVPKGAQRPQISDDLPTRGLSGYAVMLAITVRHGKGEKVLPSGLDLSSAVEAKKVLKQAGFTVPVQDGGAGAQLWTEPDDPTKTTQTTHLELPLVPLPEKPGRNGMVLPPLPVAVARANGEIATVCTHNHSIIVEDPISNTPNAMPKLNPPALVQREEWTALKKALAYGSLGLLLGAIIAYFVYRKINQPKPEPPPPPPRPPWEVALEQLDEVRHAGLLEVHRYGEHFDRTSDAIRRYLGARFGFDGLESTTDEILASLKKQAGGFIRFDAPTAADGRPSFGPAPGVSFDKVASFLRDCDLVKFANLTPTPDQCAMSITTGEAIVRGTMPISSGGSPTAVMDDAPTTTSALDPIAAARLRTPAVPATPKRERSPWEPPDPEDTPGFDSSAIETPPREVSAAVVPPSSPVSSPTSAPDTIRDQSPHTDPMPGAPRQRRSDDDDDDGGEGGSSS